MPEDKRWENCIYWLSNYVNKIRCTLENGEEKEYTLDTIARIYLGIHTCESDRNYGYNVHLDLNNRRIHLSKHYDKNEKRLACKLDVYENFNQFLKEKIEKEKNE